MNAGFTIRCRDGKAEVELLTCEEARGNPLISVAHDAPTQTVAVLLGRLDYRAEFDLKHADKSRRDELTDAEFVLAVWLDEGKDGLKRLEGEFALAIWDGRQRRLVGMRDPLGSWPLYFSHGNAMLAMGTSLRSLGDDQRPGVDLDYVAEFFARPFIPSEVPCVHTASDGIERVLPGTIVELHFDSTLQRHVYWDWASRIHAIGADSLDDVADRFRDLLERAVRQRMRHGKFAAHLSGGMDSSAVAVLARRHIAGSSNPDPLVSISLTYRAAELAGERRQMDLVLEQGGPIEPCFVEGDAAVGFDWFRQPIPAHDEPYAGLWSLAANRLLVDAARQNHVNTVLTGVGADEILTYRPLHIADLLRRGRLMSAFHEASVWGKAQGLGMWSMIRKHGIAPLWRRGIDIPPWIRRDFARERHLRDRFNEFGRQTLAQPAEHSETLARLSMTSGDWARWHLYAPNRMNISHPFLDPRVACYTLGISRNVRAAPGDPKPVLRTAMKGLLPDPVRNRREKTGFDGPHARGMAAHANRLEEMVCHSRIHELGIFDTDKLLTTMRRVALGISGRHNEWLDRTLALVAWYEQR